MKKIITTIMAVTCLLGSSISLCSCNEVTKIDDEKIVVNFRYDYFEGKNYEKVRKKFIDYGFKNIVVEFLGNLDSSNDSEEGTLNSLRIKDSTYFLEGKTYSCYDPVLLYVNSNKKDMEIEFEEKDGMIPYPFYLFDFEKYDIKEAEPILKNMGFTDVKFHPEFKNYINEEDAECGKIFWVLVDGEKPISNPGYVSKDTTIELYYNCTPGLYCFDGLPHSLVDEPGIEATCSTPGRKAGKRCTRCNEFIQGGYSTLCKEHEYENDVNGSKICKKCNAEYAESDIEIAESIEDLLKKDSVTNDEIKAFCKANIGKEVSFICGEGFEAKLAPEGSESKSKYEFSFFLQLLKGYYSNSLNDYKIVVRNTKNLEQFPLDESFEYWSDVCYALLLQNFYKKNGYNAYNLNIFIQDISGEIIDYSDDTIFISFSNMDFHVGQQYFHL